MSARSSNFIFVLEGSCSKSSDGCPSAGGRPSRGHSRGGRRPRSTLRAQGPLARDAPINKPTFPASSSAQPPVRSQLQARQKLGFPHIRARSTFEPDQGWSPSHSSQTVIRARPRLVFKVESHFNFQTQVHCKPVPAKPPRAVCTTVASMPVFHPYRFSTEVNFPNFPPRTVSVPGLIFRG